MRLERVVVEDFLEGIAKLGFVVHQDERNPHVLILSLSDSHEIHFNFSSGCQVQGYHLNNIVNYFDVSSREQLEAAVESLFQGLVGRSLRNLRTGAGRPAPNARNENGQWDFFLSHASEDKDEFARPLAQALQAAGASVWFDEFTLKIGDSLRRSIDKGLASSQFGIVLISPAFLAKEWPQMELDALVGRESQGHRMILPVWHNVDAHYVGKFSPLLLDRVAANSFDGVEAVAARLLEVRE